MERLIRVAILGTVTLLFVTMLSSFAYSVTPAKQGVSFLNLTDEIEVKSPFPVSMNVVGKTVAVAGDPAPNSGHHHIIIDGTFVEQGQVIPADATHLHFGKGQTTTELTLPPGKHTLTLQFADTNHLSFGKEWSQTVRVTVIE